MIHGAQVRLHPKTICHISAPGRDFDDEPVTVTAFVAAKSKWKVALQLPQRQGKELLVPETSLRFCCSVLPESVGQLKKLAKLVDDDQGACGRGFKAGEAIPPFRAARHSSRSRRS